MFERNNSKLLQYEMMLDDEKRELVEIVCSNFSVRGNFVEFMLRSPFKEIAETADPQRCAHHRDNVRTKRVLDVLKNIAEKEIAGSNGYQPAVSQVS